MTHYFQSESFSSCSSRTGTLCLRPYINPLARCNLCFSVYLQHCSTKLYMVPSVCIARFHSLTVCAKTGSPTIHGSQVGNDAPFPVDNDRNVFFDKPNSLLDKSSHSANNASEFEQHLQVLFGEIKTLISSGKGKDAIDLLEANYQEVKEQLDAGFVGIEEAAMLDIIALGYMAVGDLKMVGSLLELMNNIVDCLVDGEAVLDSVLLHMGSMYSSLGKFQKSKLMYQRAVRILEKLYGKHSIFLVTPLLGLAKVNGSTGKATEAVEIYKHVIYIMELSHGTDSADLVLPLSGLGNLLLKQGKTDEAEIPFTRILNLYSKLHGETDGKVGVALCSLAHVKCAQGKTDEAIHLYEKALQVIKDSGSMALDDNIMEKMRIDLAELLHVVGRGSEGRELLEECLVITRKHKGKDHPDLATQYINLATSYSFAKNYVEAERLLRMALRVMINSVGPDDPSITFPMLHLAVTLFHLKRDKEAERLAVDVLRIREAAFRKECLPVGEALDCLVSIQSRLGEDDKKLLGMLNRVLGIQEKEFGYESEEVMVTLKKIIFYLDRLGRKQEKFPLQKRLTVLRNKYRNKVQHSQ